MSFQVSWYVEHRVVYNYHYGEVTVEELAEAAAVIYGYLEQTLEPAYLIVDTTDVTRHPYSLTTLQQTLGKRSHPNIAWAIGIAPSNVTRMLSSMLNQVMQMQEKYVATREEALDFLQRLDKTLPDLSQEPPIPYTAQRPT